MFEADSAPRESGGIREVLGNLDAATREFTRRLEELAALGTTPARTNGASPAAGSPPRQPAAEPLPTVAARAAAEPAAAQPGPQPAPTLRFRSTQAGLDRRMADADAEATRYLEQAKKRADTMVQSIVAAVEQEADAMRRDAEQQIRARWRQVEADAERFLDDARRAADGLVADRQRRISAVSDTIVGLAETLAARMVDADHIRRQFDMLVVALSDTAGRLAADPAAAASPAAIAEPQAVPASDPVAAAPAGEPAADTATEMWWRNLTGGSGVDPATRARAA